MINSIRNILITGANGFIGKNLMMRLSELPDFSVTTFVRGDKISILPELLTKADIVVHLAGENRPIEESSFAEVNTDLTLELCKAIRAEFLKTGRKLSLILESSTQAEIKNPYGLSKLGAEKAVYSYLKDVECSVSIFRLPGVFGKWSKPKYNSVVATFCHNIARDIPIQINDPSSPLKLVYIDDVLDAFLESISISSQGISYKVVEPEYQTTVGDLADQIKTFNSRCSANLLIENVGVNFLRALYATYLTFIPTNLFSYKIPEYKDDRGKFVEVLKTNDSGQFSYFTAHPGITRGGHYHHTKSEKFVVIKGHALFRFRHILTNELYDLRTSGDDPQIVDTIPGWAHDITNVGNEELVVMLWANENFDRQKPDTVASEV